MFEYLLVILVSGEARDNSAIVYLPMPDKPICESVKPNLVHYVPTTGDGYEITAACVKSEVLLGPSKKEGGEPAAPELKAPQDRDS